MTAAAPRVARPMRELSNRGVLAIALAGFCTFLDVYATQPLLPLFERVFAATPAQAGLTVSATTAAVALAAPVIGLVADRASRRRVIVLSLALLAVPTLLAATSRGLWELVAWRFLQGAVVPGVYVLAIAYITEEAGASAVGTVMAALVTGTVLGGFGGRVVTGVIAAHAGWREAFVAMSVMNVVGAAVVWRLLPASRHFAPVVRERQPWRERRPALTGRALVSTYAIGFNLLFALVATFSYVMLHLHAPPYGLDTDALSAIFVVYLVGAAVTPVAGGWIDRAGSRAVLIGATVAGMAGLALTLVAPLAAILVGLAVACTAAFIGQSAAASHLRVVSPPVLRSLASGLYVTTYYVGGSVGGVLPGLLWRRAGWVGCVVLVWIALALSVGLAILGWREPRAEGVT